MPITGTHDNRFKDLVIAWTSSLAWQYRNSQLSKVAIEFVHMRKVDDELNHITYTTLLSSCADFPLGTISFGVSIHAHARKLEYDSSAENATDMKWQ